MSIVFCACCKCKVFLEKSDETAWRNANVGAFEKSDKHYESVLHVFGVRMHRWAKSMML